MDFIDLDDVLKGIVACIPPRRYIPIPLPEKFKDGALVRDNALVMRARKFLIRAERTIDNARRFSEAAQKLNKALHDDAKPPQWMQFDKVKGFAVRADSISAEGLALLTHATGWEKRERKLSHEHVKDCTRNGWGPGTMHPARSTDDGLTPAGSYFRPREIGFDRAELLAFLDGKVTHSIESTAPAQNTATPAPVVAVVALVEPAKAGPLPLTTGDIAFCFAGLRWKTETEWKKPLGDKPKWLAACIVIPGVQGVSETRWSPVCIGAALVHAGHAKPNSVRAKFQTQPLLTPWLDEWKTYEADNHPTD